MSSRENFIVPKKFNTVSLVLMAIGILAIIGLYVTSGSKSDPHQQARFWGSLLQNSVYFLLVVNAAMFFICATTLGWGGFQLAFGRVSEAVSACVPVMGVICGAILLSIAFGGNHEIYHWTDAEHVKHDPTLLHKAGFLSKGFFAVVTVLTIVLWSFLGWKMRQRSRMLDENPLPSVEEGKKYIWTNTVWAALYLVVFALTVMSSIPWLWLMSIDAHWYSTMYSWYTFASTFVAGIAVITLFVIYLKNHGYLPYTNNEHLHDLGKFQFAFSIFWTYLWFSQFMLIWYANIPEETVYFKPRAEGIYSGIFWLMLIINFVAPILILMSRDAKRNYTTMTFMSMLIVLGHWLDFFQMVFPSPSPEHVPSILYDFGIALGFVGLIMFVTTRTLAKFPLLAKNHPFIKESIIHHT
ncbi:quinol:cytochrome C oxidoreductase [Terrimonas pollutisoli]|uniref:quinol:cytochrome C oxidoreductase n=1 Tax=Terrimonas pollutisoli TaxID=3034147 RepID=UPI0023EC5EF4|nr:quinol:cytochrome C oxidoreductase [Terrimonas sp. H1YJ31]